MGEFDQCILMHIPLCLYLCISILYFGYFSILICFYKLVCFCTYLIFVLYFSALAVFTNKFITGATGIGLRRSTRRRKAKTESYDSNIWSEANSDCSRARKSIEVAALVLF